MAWSRTLANLVADVQDRADLGGYTLRHPPDKILRKLVESYQSLREWMTDAGSMAWVGGPYAIKASAGMIPCEYGISVPLISEVSGGAFTFVISHLYRLEAFYQGRWHAVDRVGFDERVKWSGGGSSTGLPLEYCVLGRGANLDGTIGELPEPTATLTADLRGMSHILVMPMQAYANPPAYPLRMFGMPSLTIAQSEDTQLTLETTGFEWLILDAMVKCIMRDNDSDGRYQMATTERANAEKRIRDSIRSEFKSSAQRSDVFANRRSRRRETWR
jgi:hypothetical protein